MGNTVMMNDGDVVALDELEAAGIDLQFQLLPDDAIRTWPTLKAKYQSM